MWIKLKGKANWIYIASLLLYAEGAQAWFTEFYLQNTPRLYLVIVYQTASPLIVVADI